MFMQNFANYKQNIFNMSLYDRKMLSDYNQKVIILYTPTPVINYCYITIFFNVDIVSRLAIFTPRPRFNEGF